MDFNDIILTLVTSVQHCQVCAFFRLFFCSLFRSFILSFVLLFFDGEQKGGIRAFDFEAVLSIVTYYTS